MEVLEGKSHFVELAGNLVPVTKSGDQLSLRFYAFRENRLPFNVRVKDPNSEPLGRIAFTKEPKNNRQDSSSSSQAPQVLMSFHFYSKGVKTDKVKDTKLSIFDSPVNGTGTGSAGTYVAFYC